MNCFRDVGLSQLPRILGLMDRQPSSDTYGCVDRPFWHYKTTDFSNARMQEACLVLTMAFLIDDLHNRFYQREEMKEWALAAIKFWVKKRHGDGSTDESYPFEHHFCSTAFTLYSVTETLLRLNLHTLPLGGDDLNNTGRFLLKHHNLDVANQMACAAAALYNLFLITKDKKYEAGYEEKIARLFKMQDAKGFFNEYGGFDLGYDSITLSFLADLFKKTGRKDIETAAKKCVNHLSPLIDADGYYTCDGMSRETQFLYPFGFLMFAPDILKRMERGISENIILNPSWMDDRYCIPLTANYLLTAFEGARQ